MRDPDLNRLVRELNAERAREAEMAGREAELHEMEPANSSPDPRLVALVDEMSRRGASDLTLLAGVPPIYRVRGELVVSERESLEHASILRIFARHLDGRLRAQYDRDGYADLSLTIQPESGAKIRVRVNLHRQRGTVAAAIRSLPTTIPTYDDLALPPILSDFMARPNGLVLVCGPTGAGKSTTLAAMIGDINARSARHVITIEDPIEYEHANRKSIVEQIEIGRDSSSFATALRAALRQDPDVILVGEMRDLETISTSITAAETGHLILSTLHTSSAAQAVDRIIDVFPAEQQPQIRQQLALSLTAIVCQQLIPTADKRRRLPATEIVIANDPVRNHIRKQKLQNLYSEITLGKRLGMITLEESLANLVKAGRVSVDEARAHANRPEELENFLRS